MGWGAKQGGEPKADEQKKDMKTEKDQGHSSHGTCLQKRRAQKTVMARAACTQGATTGRYKQKSKTPTGHRDDVTTTHNTAQDAQWFSGSESRIEEMSFLMRSQSFLTCSMRSFRDMAGWA